MPRAISMLAFTCTVCDRRSCAVVSLFPFNDHRRPAMAPLLYCINCRSAHFNHEPRNDASLEWHKQVLQRNTEWSNLLLQKLSTFGAPKRVIDIGCGIGTWLRHLRAQGISGLGFDTGTASVAYGQQEMGLDLRCEFFTAEHAAARAFDADLLTAIMVMEHLSAPRPFAEQVAKYCARHGARFFVSVPWLEDLGHLDFDDESGSYNVFNDVGAHVTYFSHEGLTRMMSDFGMKVVGTVTGLAWTGLLFEAKTRVDPSR